MNKSINNWRNTMQRVHELIVLMCISEVRFSEIEDWRDAFFWFGDVLGVLTFPIVVAVLVHFMYW